MPYVRKFQHQGTKRAHYPDLQNLSIAKKFTIMLQYHPKCMMAYCSTIVNEDNIFYSFHFCFLLVFSFNSSLFFSWKNLSQSSSPLSLSLSLSPVTICSLFLSRAFADDPFSPHTSHQPLSLYPFSHHSSLTVWLWVCQILQVRWHGQGSGSCYGDEIDVVVGLQIGFGHGW